VTSIINCSRLITVKWKNVEGEPGIECSEAKLEVRDWLEGCTVLTVAAKNVVQHQHIAIRNC